MNGKGASRLMIVTFFQVNVWFEEVFGFSPLGTGQRIQCEAEW